MLYLFEECYTFIKDAAAILNSKAILYVNSGIGNYADSGF